MQFVRQKLKTIRTWSIFIKIAKSTPQNQKYGQARLIGHVRKIQKIYLWSSFDSDAVRKTKT